MKKNILFLTTIITIFLLTGCVKFNTNMDINKDKSMNISITYAFDTSYFGDKEIINVESKEKLSKEGFTLEKYIDNSMEGYIITKKIKNIDTVSVATDVIYNLSKITKNPEDSNRMFKVKKGIFKNTYIANFKFDSKESELNNSESNKSNILGSNISLDNENFKNNNIDLSFSLNLPYSAKSHNATESFNNNKKLIWTLNTNNINSIEFEFQLYNKKTITIFIIIIIILILLLSYILLSKLKKRKIKYKK